LNAVTIDTTYIKSTPAPITSSNYFAVLDDSWTDEDDDDKTIITSNKSQYEHCNNATVSTHSLTDDDTSVEEEFQQQHNKLGLEKIYLDNCLTNSMGSSYAGSFDTSSVAARAAGESGSLLPGFPWAVRAI
jgi:phage terminase large subunit-like protein